jgi:kinesin family protein 18/19
VTEIFPPNRLGTPKHRKPAVLLGPSPIKALAQPSFGNEPMLPGSSPMKASPRRVKLGVKKAARLTPNKKSPVKAMRRGVRWRDDTEDGKLAEFQATPKAIESTPEMSSNEPAPAAPSFSSSAISAPSFSAPAARNSSSPIPTPPEPSIDITRFHTGCLSKKADGSPLSSAPTSSLLNNLSDSDTSPLRELELNAAPHRSSLHLVSNAAQITPPESSGSSSEDENQQKGWSINSSEAKKIRSALKRSSSVTGPNHSRAQRRRSPTATSSGSPPSENSLFTASQARRMVKSDKGDDWKTSVLSPRTVPIGKAPIRRTTMGGEERSREASATLRAAPVRMSSVAPGYAGPTVAAAVRSSLAPGGKGSWR